MKFHLLLLNNQIRPSIDLNLNQVNLNTILLVDYLQ